MGYMCIQYTYECACGWTNELDPFLVPALPNINCPRCKGVAHAVSREVPYPFRGGKECRETITT